MSQNRDVIDSSHIHKISGSVCRKKGGTRVREVSLSVEYAEEMCINNVKQT